MAAMEPSETKRRSLACHLAELRRGPGTGTGTGTSGGMFRRPVSH
jgi:hypothetical protein